jgi:hypothetical protein
MIDGTALLLVAALAAPSDSAARAPTPTDSVVAALVSAQVRAGDELRVRGGFGQVRARASTIGPHGLDLLLPPRGLTDPSPARTLSWSEIDRIERGESRQKDGQRIGVVIGAFLGFALAMSWFSSQSGEGSPLALGLGVGAGVGCAFLGRSLGGAVGAAKPRWKMVYERR